MNILYIEDDQEIGQWVEKKLQAEGYHTHWLTSGYQLPVDLQTYGVVVLDVMLPGLDGFSVGKRIKRQNPDLPVIMLSARTSIEDKLEGLEFADDYMTKPFHPEELLKRIEVQVRKYEKAPEKTISVGHLSVRLDQQVVVDQSSNHEILLTGKQFSIFHFFIRHLNQILTKEQLYEGVWGEPYREGDKSLMVHIRHLREKIERNPSTPEIIETIRGIGYRVRA